MERSGAHTTRAQLKTQMTKKMFVRALTPKKEKPFAPLSDRGAHSENPAHPSPSNLRKQASGFSFSTASAFEEALPRRAVKTMRPSSLKRANQTSFGWFPYVSVLFFGLKPYQISAAPFFFIHVLRRIIFVAVAMYFFEYPWLQVFLYMLQSLGMAWYLIAK